MAVNDSCESWLWIWMLAGSDDCILAANVGCVLAVNVGCECGCECWLWILAVNVGCECWLWMLAVNGCECWLWMLAVNVGCECWLWMLAVNVGCECWLWILAVNIGSEDWVRWWVRTVKDDDCKCTISWKMTTKDDCEYACEQRREDGCVFGYCLQMLTVNVGCIMERRLNAAVNDVKTTIVWTVTMWRMMTVNDDRGWGCQWWLKGSTMACECRLSLLPTALKRLSWRWNVFGVSGWNDWHRTFEAVYQLQFEHEEHFL
jgi:hypothetical protein